MDNTLPQAPGLYWGRLSVGSHGQALKPHNVILEVTGEAPCLMIHLHSLGRHRRAPMLVSGDTIGQCVRDESNNITFGARIEEPPVPEPEPIASSP